TCPTTSSGCGRTRRRPTVAPTSNVTTCRCRKHRSPRSTCRWASLAYGRDDAARHRLRLGLHPLARHRDAVNVIGLTLSHNQKAHLECRFAACDSPRSKRVLLMPWEEFDEPVDRIVSIGAFEHFGFEKYDFYFKKTYDLLPDDG